MYFLYVIIQGNHIIFKPTAKLLIVASVLCILFGNGLHLHSFFTHLFDHGDIHAYVHAHSNESNHDQDPEFKDKDAHQHPTATVDLTATLIQKTTSKASTNTVVFSTLGILSSPIISKSLILLYLDLSSTDLLLQSDYFSSYSTRGPPLG